ncbi:MAG: DNA-processing protein DprA [Alphaproteobacteria bacterium]|nr:DNA-processing protein DprA [Alphaproteobacteria bacterium]
MVDLRPLNESERLDWLRLSRSENVGPITFMALLERYGSAARALEALPELARSGGRKRSIKLFSKAAAEREIAALTKLGGRLLACHEPGYPAPLAALPDAPPLIALRGHGHLLEGDIIAMVGARNASANGIRFARQLAVELGAAGFKVASGMARGIDTAAHRGALESGTLAVMGGGVDVIYPKQNAALYEEIVARGVIIAEPPLGTAPQARHFPQRNRIISGLARGVIVVEAAPRSGSLITARLAAEQGREVFAVPGSPLDPRSRGCNGLIRDGATLVQGAEDIVEALAGVAPQALDEPPGAEFAAPEMAAVGESKLAAARPVVLDLLGPSPVPIDELMRQSRLTPALLLTILLEFELAGRLERHAGGQVSLIESMR